MYAEGVKKDGKLALEWNNKAAEKNNEMAIRNMAICYDFGIGTKKDAAQAVEWYKKLIRLAGNDRFAYYRIALCLTDPDKEYKIKPTDEMYAEAVKCAKQAVEAGEDNANYVLGYCHMMGKGLPKDLDKAYTYLDKAAKVGNAKASEKLACFSKNGLGKYVLR